MAYSEHAKALRRCQATRNDGNRCQAWAMWLPGAKGQCSAHAGHVRGPGKSIFDRFHVEQGTRIKPCTCTAYAWPHRIAAGFCRWPDPPIRRCPTPAGTHAEPRIRIDTPRIKRALQALRGG